MTTIQEILLRLESLEKAFLQSQENIIDTVSKADMTPMLEQKVTQNETDISDNREGITETFENSLLNTDDISSLREGLEEVYEMLLESEVE